MKFIYCFITILVITLSLKTIYTVKIKTESSAENSIMDFLSNLYETTNSEKGAPPAKNKNSNQVVVNQIIKRRHPDIFMDDSELDMIKEGWLRISSPLFTNENVYPKVISRDFSPDYIDVSPDSSFRKNNLFNVGNSKNPAFPPSENSFWFRLSKRNLFYSHSKSELSTLGTIAVPNLLNAEVNPKKNKKANDAFCFFVMDKQSSNWQLCAETASERMQWMCKIKELKKIPDDRCIPAQLAKELNVVPVTAFERKVNMPIILIPQPNRFCNDDWNYEAKGADWECECSDGLEQSPINILTAKVIESPVVPVFSYVEVEVKTTENTDSGQVKVHKYVEMKNKNHMIQIKATSFGKVVTLDGTAYNANRIVFHTPSEHTINGSSYPMEMQIIHSGVSEGAINKHVVLSFLFIQKPGIYNKFLDDIDFFNLPNVIAKKRKMETDLYIPKIFYSSDDEDIPIMRPFSLYTYQGSLTYPPCTQNTIHYVAADPIEVGTSAIQLFMEAIRMPDLRASNGDVIVSTATTNNARKEQNLNGRNVFFNKVERSVLAKKPPPPPKPQGHYEKIVKKINNYYYINNNHPSGMPGAIVVSESEAKGSE